MALPRFLLKEDGDHLLLETGDKIILNHSYLIEGVAYLSGSPTPGVKITLIDSDTDTVVDTAVTDSNGAYSFEGLDVAKQYHVTAELDDDPNFYNAKSLPFLTPVN